MGARRQFHVYGEGMTVSDHPIRAVLLAGSRPSGDPLAQAAGVASKALVPVGGQTMLGRVARQLCDHPRIGEVLILAQQGPELLASAPDTGWLTGHAKVRFVKSGQGISQSLLDLSADTGTAFPLLVTTVDHVLLDRAMLDAFMSAVRPDSDIAVAMVERGVLLERYPQSRRTWLKFRGGWWSGANLFWLGSERARAGLQLWRGVEQDRKKGWRILSALGPGLLLAALFRLRSAQQVLAQAGKRLGLDAQLVAMPMAEACIDADKPADITLIEEIWEAQEG
jgi:GTP:adenosylcobinamide-phosphate guanylyltransferase